MSGKAIIISAPSGSGKTTIVRHLLKTNRLLQFSISATTRDPRPLERDGVDYYFLSIEDFMSRQFVEKEEVYEGIYYGTLKAEVERIWQKKGVVLFDVDVEGGINLKKYFGDNALSIFIKVESINIIEERLKKRDTESPENLKERVDKASREMTFEKNFDIVILNQNLDLAQNEVETAINQFIG